MRRDRARHIPTLGGLFGAGSVQWSWAHQGIRVETCGTRPARQRGGNRRQSSGTTGTEANFMSRSSEGRRKAKVTAFVESRKDWRGSHEEPSGVVL